MGEIIKACINFPLFFVLFFFFCFFFFSCFIISTWDLIIKKEKKKIRSTSALFVSYCRVFFSSFAYLILGVIKVSIFFLCWDLYFNVKEGSFLQERKRKKHKKNALVFHLLGVKIGLRILTRKNYNIKS